MAENTKRYVSDQFLAERYSKTRGTIWNWARGDTGFPKPVKLGPATTRWDLDEIEAWEARKAAEAEGAAA
ncbi:MAG: AlpA family phage regulatory protein [Paracoccaceae bacterium]|jgi:predicted DNA-binding transcriptional regulator AlpA|nr:AlpA family phage regulatory protein [Paracoccaceae bacterium]